MEVTESILRRIQKCLALSKSPNEHEAAAALRQATKLMAAYNVTPEALVGAQIGEALANTDAWTKPPQWEMNLMHLLAEAFGCECVLYIGSSQWQRLTRICYVGLKHQAEVAAYAHETLRRQVVRARSQFMGHSFARTRAEKMAQGESFCLGFVSSLRKQVDALAVTPEVEIARREYKQRLLGENENKPYKAPGRGFDYNAAAQGAEEGKKASVHRGVGTTTSSGSLK